MFTIRKIFKFEAAHILSKAYTSQCTECIHGHSYKVEVFLSSSTLKDDMVVDFGILKEIVDPLIRDWDHALLIPKGLLTGEELGCLTKWNKKIRLTSNNPTAEYMAWYLFKHIKQRLHEGPSDEEVPFISKVRVWETDTGYAEYTEE